jgi:hypothetical protein
MGLHIDVQDMIPAGANVGQAYPVSYKPVDISLLYLTSNGVGQPGYATKFAFTKNTASAAVVDTDLTNTPCSDGTTSFAHVRELIVLNDDPTHNLVVAAPTNTFTSQYMSGTVTIPPGSFHRMPPVPLGSNGLVVDSTHCLVRVDPSTFNVAYRILAIGD